MKRATPSSVKIGPYFYRLVFDKEALRALEAKDESLAGYCDPEAGVITINPGLAPDQLRSAVIHEVLHALIQSAGSHRTPGWSEELEEYICSSLESGLLSLVRDNPELVGWLERE